jgi:hypothetical protein
MPRFAVTWQGNHAGSFILRTPDNEPTIEQFDHRASS